MKFRDIAIILSLTIFLSACATYPRNPEDQATYFTKNAKAAILESDSTYAATQIELALTCPTGDAKIKELFASYPKGRDFYRVNLEQSIADVASVNQAAAVHDKLSTAKSAGIFSEDQVRDFCSNLMKVVSEGNFTGSIPFDLGDRINLFPELNSPAHQQLIANRSIKNLQDNSSASRQVTALMEYVQRIGIDSAEGKRIESLLPSMNIRGDELDVIAKVFPQFAATRKEEITARVYLQVKNGDRLLRDDFLQMLRNKIRGVEWVPSPDPKATTLVIEQLRNNEITLPERSQTITYAQHEVNLISAALLMPRNASYLYDFVSGGAEIEYGYVVSAVANARTIYDEVVRGKVRGEYHVCQNARIRNVFGGVSSASFVANNDMQRRCAGPNSVSIDELRKEVFSKVVDAVLKVPPIMNAHEFN